ncbi:MAG: ATP-binding cassette domain-containing protein [Spirochaetales bacterium]|nr:ATP-binding cassette domain-containing protein [Spirochaetales bacterium]
MPDKIIVVDSLTRVFKIRERSKPGLIASIASFLSPVSKTITAVDNISFSLDEGEIRGLIGPNGAGKSTTIKILSGVLYPTSGKVDVLGYVPWLDRKTYVRSIGVLFGQKSQLIWELPALDTFELHKVIYRIPDGDFENRIDSFIELLAIGDIVRKPVRQLSLGERMKCELVCAMLHDPRLVFLDEPTIGVDVISKEAIRGFIKKVNRERNITFIITTHDLSDIQNLCNTVTIINKGKKIFDDSIDKLTSRFSDKKVLKLDFSAPVEESGLSAYKVLDFSPGTCLIEVEVKEKSIRDIIYELFSEFPLRDITITSIPIEEVIKTMYLA